MAAGAEPAEVDVALGARRAAGASDCMDKVPLARDPMSLGSVPDNVSWGALTASVVQVMIGTSEQSA